MIKAGDWGGGGWGGGQVSYKPQDGASDQKDQVIRGLKFQPHY